MRGVGPIQGRGGREGQRQSPWQPAAGEAPASPGERQMDEEADGAEERGVDPDTPQDRLGREGQARVEKEDQPRQMGAEEGAWRGARGQDVHPAGAPRRCPRGLQGRLRR